MFVCLFACFSINFFWDRDSCTLDWCWIYSPVSDSKCRNYKHVPSCLAQLFLEAFSKQPSHNLASLGTPWLFFQMSYVFNQAPPILRVPSCLLSYLWMSVQGKTKEISQKSTNRQKLGFGTRLTSFTQFSSLSPALSFPNLPRLLQGEEHG